MKKLALLDMDGTLFDTNDVNFYAYNEAMNEAGFKMIEYDYYCKFCNGRHYTEFLPKFTDNKKETIEQIHKRKKELYSSFLDKAKINNHLFNIIKAIIDSYYLAIVTTASKKNVNEILNYFQVYDIFDLILTADDIKKKKPDPEGFLKAMHFFNIEPENTLIFEDSIPGIEAARKTKATIFTVDFMTENNKDYKKRTRSSKINL